MDILDVLDKGMPMVWRVGKVSALYAGKMYVDVTIGQPGDPSAPVMRQVTYMVGYGRAPRVGDIVHVLVKPDMGALILGTVTP